MAGHFRVQPDFDSQRYPARPQFEGFMKPCRYEGEIRFLEVEGTIPNEIDGIFYRVMPDPQLPPFIRDDPVRWIVFHIPYTYHDVLIHLSGLTAMETSVLSVLKMASVISSNATSERRSSLKRSKHSGHYWVKASYYSDIE